MLWLCEIFPKHHGGRKNYETMQPDLAITLSESFLAEMPIANSALHAVCNRHTTCSFTTHLLCSWKEKSIEVISKARSKRKRFKMCQQSTDGHSSETDEVSFMIMSPKYLHTTKHDTHVFLLESKRSLGSSLKQLIQSSDVSACCSDLPQGYKTQTEK